MPKPSPFPPCTLDEAKIIAVTLYNQNGGNPMRRLTLFDVLGRSPESSTSRNLITASSAYGLTTGSYAAEEIRLTDRGRLVAQNDALSMFDAVLSNEIFKGFYEKYKNSQFPLEKAAIDFLLKQGLSDVSAKICLKIIIANGDQLHLIQEISGAKRIVTVEHALETFSRDDTLHLGSVDTKKSVLDNSRQVNVQQKKEEVLAEPSQLFTPNLHIDIQIHISADAKPEQIDHIFASMAKHLYGRE